MRTIPLMALTTCALTASVAQTAPVITEQNSGVRSNLIAVSAVNEQVVWVSGARGTVLRTLDGGKTWEIRPVAEDAATLEFRDIHALSADTAWALSIGNGASSRIYRTTDGGRSWTPQFINSDPSAFYDCLTIFDANHGVAFSDTPSDGKLRLLRTEDGGNWKQLTELPAALPKEGGYASSGGCVSSFGAKHGWVALGTPKSRVLRTTDAGKSWAVSATPLFVGDSTPANTGGLTAVAFNSATHGMVVAARISPALDTTSAAVAVSEDGGESWTMRPRPPAGSIYGVTWIPGAGATSAILSTLGGLMLTRDDGHTWSAVTEANRYWGVGAAGKTAWGVGPGGRITKVQINGK